MLPFGKPGRLIVFRCAYKVVQIYNYFDKLYTIFPQNYIYHFRHLTKKVNCAFIAHCLCSPISSLGFLICPLSFFLQPRIKESNMLILCTLLSLLKIHSVYFFLLFTKLKAHLFALYSSLPFFRKSFP